MGIRWAHIYALLSAFEPLKYGDDVFVLIESRGPRMIEDHSSRLVFALLKLAEMGAHRRTAKISTGYLAQKLDLSQQTASRYLIELDRLGWVTRTMTPDGCLIRITSAGIKELNKLYTTLRFLMETPYPPSITLEGTVFNGLGEGAYYISKEPYRRQFIEKLGFDPYPGTLNLKLTTEYDIKTRNELESYPAVEIEGFKSEDRTFGPVKCYPVIVDNKVKGALISALRSHYDASVLEIIAPVQMRKHLALKDGHKVKVEVLTLP
jgi:riboflavin kinase, archaea type